MAEKLTDRVQIAVAVAQTDLVHIVDVSDTSQDPAGSSFKGTAKQLINSYVSDGSEGALAYWDNSTSKYIPISTSGIYHDAVNNRIGVGINTGVSAKLHVKSASGEAFRIDGSATNANLIVTDANNVGVGGSTFTGLPVSIPASGVRFKVFGASASNYASIQPSTFFVDETIYMFSGSIIGADANIAGLNYSLGIFTFGDNDLYLGRNSVVSQRFVTGNYILSVCNQGALADATHGNNQMSFWVDESGNTLNFKVKYSTGTVKSGSIALV